MFWTWKQTPSLNPVAPDQVAGLQGAALSDEKTRSEIEKLRIDILEERSWRTKLFLSLIIPVGGALAFLNTWVNDHSAERRQRNDQTYTQAAQQLGSSEASVRLNAIIVLSSFVQERSWLQSFVGSSSPGVCAGNKNLRGRQAMALVVGHLADEPDAAVLDQVAAIADECPEMALAPLLSLDRSAAVRFARSAGNFVGVYLLAKQKAIALNNEGGPDSLSQTNRDLLDAITTRSGSPFEAKDAQNQIFVSAPMLRVGACPFGSLYNKQFDLTVSSAVNHPLLDKPPSVTDVRSAMGEMMKDAELLEKVSYVLNRLAQDDRSLALLQDETFLKEQTFSPNLYGVALVVGDWSITDPGGKDRAAALRSMGALVQHHDDPNPCALPQTPKPLR